MAHHSKKRTANQGSNSEDPEAETSAISFGGHAIQVLRKESARKQHCDGHIVTGLKFWKGAQFAGARQTQRGQGDAKCRTGWHLRRRL